MQSSGGTKRVLVAGASGYIGRAVVRELVSRRYEVLALVRRPVKDPAVQDCLAGAELRCSDVCDTASLRRGLRGEHFEVVVSCIASRSGMPKDARRVDRDANLSLLEQARACGAHFVLLSAICVQKPELAFQRAKLQFEKILAESGLRHSIVRPTAFFKSLAGQVERVKRGKPFLVFGNGELTACKPISQADLARFIAECIVDSDKHDRVLTVGGPGPALTPRQQAELLFRLLDQRPRFRKVPLGLFSCAIALLNGLGRVIPALRDRAEFARIGRYYARESMLVWDEDAGRYDADATPEYGKDTLEAFYRRVLDQGMVGQELGDAAAFDRSRP